MKKYARLIVMIVVVTLCVVGCFSKKNEMQTHFVVSTEENNVHLKCKKAEKGLRVSATIHIEENEELAIRTNLENVEKVNIQVYPVEHNDSTKPLVDLDGYEVNSYSYPLDPGTYEVQFTALNPNVNGFIDVSAEQK